MKKKCILLLGLLALTMAVGGCGKKEETAPSAASETSAAQQSTADTNILSEIEVPADYVPPATMAELTDGLDLDSLVKLGTYKGLKVTKEIAEVNDSDIDNAVADALESTFVEVDKAAENGDTVNIDYVGTMEGEEFEGGSAQGFDLKLGSHRFIEGFEEGLVGAKKGDVVTLDLTFPKNYTEELSEKPVQFKVTINKVQTTSKEISEDWVKDNTEFETVDDYRRSIRVQLEVQNDTVARENMEAEAWKNVLENSVVNEYPENMIQYGRYYYDQMLKGYCEQSGITVDQYMEANGMTAENYKEMQMAYAQSMAGQLLIMAAIEKAEGISANDQEYQDKYKALIESSGVDEETFFSYYERFSVEQSLMLERINKIIADNAVITEKMVEKTPESSDDNAVEEPAAQSQTEETAAAEPSESTETSISKEVLEPID